MDEMRAEYEAMKLVPKVIFKFIHKLITHLSNEEKGKIARLFSQQESIVYILNCFNIHYFIFKDIAFKLYTNIFINKII